MAKTVLGARLGARRGLLPECRAARDHRRKKRPEHQDRRRVRLEAESGGFSSTDTPDFFYEDDDERVTKQRPSINDTSHNTL